VTEQPKAASKPAPRPGRPRGGADNRQVILDAARALFADQGFAGTTIRQVATKAAVDPALVMHFFGSQRGLFESVVDLPLDGNRLVALLDQPVAARPAAFTTFLINVLEDNEQLRRLSGLLRSAATEPAVAEALRDLLATAYQPLVAAYGESARLTANMLGTLAVGLVMARTVVGIEPLATLDPIALYDLLEPLVTTILSHLPDQPDENGPSATG
jgi:AcrR family transcriptional regulator